MAPYPSKAAPAIAVADPIGVPATRSNGWVLVGTEVATIGGMKVGADGHYRVADGLIVPLAYPLTEPKTAGGGRRFLAR